MRLRSKERASSRSAVLHSANCGTCAPPRRTQAFIDACALLSPRNLRILCRPAGQREATFSGGLRGFSAFSCKLLILSASAFECVCFCSRRCRCSQERHGKGTCKQAETTHRATKNCTHGAATAPGAGRLREPLPSPQSGRLKSHYSSGGCWVSA